VFSVVGKGGYGHSGYNAASRKPFTVAR